MDTILEGILSAMKKLFITAIILILISPICQADLYKCVEEDGRVSYRTTYEELPHTCKIITPMIISRRYTKSEIAAYRWQAKQQAVQDYREKVKATARFLDDVAAARKRK